jgi:hypothetical protein
VPCPQRISELLKRSDRGFTMNGTNRRAVVVATLLHLQAKRTSPADFVRGWYTTITTAREPPFLKKFENNQPPRR